MRFAVVPEDGFGQRARTAVVQIARVRDRAMRQVGSVDLAGGFLHVRQRADAPQRLRAPHRGLRMAFGERVGQSGAHVMQQQVGVRMDHLVAQLGKRMGVAGLHLRHVTGRAAGLAEQPGAVGDAHGVDIVLRRHADARHEAAAHAALRRHADQLQVVRQLLQLALADSGGRLRRRLAARRAHVVLARTGRKHRRGHAHVEHEGAGNLLAHAALARLPAETAQVLLAGLGVDGPIGNAPHAIAVAIVGVGQLQDRDLVDCLEQPHADDLRRLPHRELRGHRTLEVVDRLLQLHHLAVGQGACRRLV